MDTRVEQTPVGRLSDESVKRAIAAIGEDFALAHNPIPLRTASGGWDVIGAFESVRAFSAPYDPKDIHVSTIAIGRGDNGKVYIWNDDGEHISIYLRQDAQPMGSRGQQQLGAAAIGASQAVV